MKSDQAPARVEDPPSAVSRHEAQIGAAGLVQSYEVLEPGLSLGALATRLSVVEMLLATRGKSLPDTVPPLGSLDHQGSSLGPPGVTKGHGEVEHLQARLDRTRAGEITARHYAHAAFDAIQGHLADLEHQVVELDGAYAKARAEIVTLSTEIKGIADEEEDAEASAQAAHTRLGSLVPDEYRVLLQRGKIGHALVLREARRWPMKARALATLVAHVDAVTAQIEEARQRIVEVRERRMIAEEIAQAAEPRASEIASAAAALRGQCTALKTILSNLPPLPDSGADAFIAYGRWVELHDTLTDQDRRAIRARLLRLDYQPLISVIVPVYETPLDLLRAAVHSVKDQIYPHWELCLADDASPDPAVFQALESFAEDDPRIKIVRRACNGHIAEASNSALALATGEFIALLDHDDILAEQALFEVVVSLNDNPDLDLIYSDEDHIDRHGTRTNPYFKTDFNYELFLGHNLVNHLGVYRRTLVEKLGGFRKGFEGSQDWDLALRILDASSEDRIHHIPAVLYHWRSDTDQATFSEASMDRCIDSARKALTEHLARRGLRGEVVAHPEVKMWHRIRRVLPAPAPLVSIIVPTRDRAEILRPCMDGILKRTDYPNFEVIIVDHQSTDLAARELIDELSRDDRVRVLPYEGVFNYSAINNAAVAEARGSVLALLNNDVEVINSDWLHEMVAVAALPDVGAVGAKLLYPDNRIQHAGVLLGAGGVAGHLSHLLDAHAPGYCGRAVLTSAVSAVTAACLVVRKSVFDEVGGFDARNLPVAFNDVDLCLKIREKGYRNVWTPHAILYHHESISRGSDQVGESVKRFDGETEFMLQKWEGLLENDPFYNPNLNLASADFSLSFPPRRKKPWTSPPH